MSTVDHACFTCGEPATQTEQVNDDEIRYFCELHTANTSHSTYNKPKIIFRNNVKQGIFKQWTYNFLVQFDDIKVGEELLKVAKQKQEPRIHIERLLYGDIEDRQLAFAYEMEVIFYSDNPFKYREYHKQLQAIIDKVQEYTK